MDATKKDDKNDDDAKSTISAAVFPIPAAQRVKRYGMDFYTNTLGAPKYVVSDCLTESDLLNTQCLNLVDKNGIKSVYLEYEDFFFIICVCDMRVSTSTIYF